MLEIFRSEQTKHNLYLHVGYYLSRNKKIGFMMGEEYRVLMEQRARVLTTCGI